MLSIFSRTLTLLLLTLSLFANAQYNSHYFMAGLRVQKTHNLYFENGVSFDYSNTHLWNRRIHFGLSYVTSRLGSAIGSNALKQDNYLLSAQLNFRNDKFMTPLIKLNTGWFYANLEDEIFDFLPNTSPLLSFEGGVQLTFKSPVRTVISLGYNFITGDGMNGPGTLLPLFFQMSVFYVMLK